MHQKGCDRKRHQPNPLLHAQPHSAKERNQKGDFRHRRLQRNAYRKRKQHLWIASVIHPKYRAVHIPHTDRMEKLADAEHRESMGLRFCQHG